MERIYIDKNAKLHKLMTLSGGISPVRVQNHLPRRCPGFDSRANFNVLSSLENLDSPIVRYYRSGGTPLSAIENLEISPKTMFKTPVKVEEDVLVMDGILVGPVTASRVRSLPSSSDSGGSLSSGGKSFYKSEICRSWEDFGSCRYGAKCQFAHGKEELRPTRFFNKSKSETQMCKSYSSVSCSYGSKCRFSHEHNNSSASGTDSPFTTPSLSSRTVSPASATDSPVSAISSKARTVSPIRLEKAMNCSGKSSSTAHTVSQNNSSASGTDSPFTTTFLSSRTVSPASATDSPVSAISSKARTVSPIKLEKAMNCSGMSSSTAHTVSQNNSSASATDSSVSLIPSKTRTVSPIKLEKAMNCAGKSSTVSENNSPASATDSSVNMIPLKTRTVSSIKLEKVMNCAGKISSPTQTVAPIKLQNSMNSSGSSCITFASTDWSPLDDGIEVVLPCSSTSDKALSSEEVDAYINSVLYGSNKRKTLPLFAAICPM